MTSRISSSTLPLRLGTEIVRVIVEPDALGQLPETLEACDVDAVVLVADERLWRVHSRTVTRLLGARASAILSVGAGQHVTALATVAAAADQAAALAGRRRCVVRFGGGTVLKLAGALAHLLDWGSPLILVPTTLLAMVDAAPSARHALTTGKRIGVVGMLHPPTAILCDPHLLATLPEVAWREGMVEALKATLALGGRDTEELATAVAELRPGPTGEEDVRRLVTQAITLKAWVLADDPAERMVGLSLHYGHTFSRALEADAGPGLRHGPAVAAGMLLAGRVAGQLGLLAAAEQEAHNAWIRRVVGTQAHPQLRALVRAAHDGGFLSVLREDPKRRLLTGNAIPLVLLERLGSVHYPPGSPAPVTAVPPAAVAAAIAAEGAECR